MFMRNVFKKIFTKIKNRSMFVGASVLTAALTLAAVHVKVLYFLLYRPYSAYLYLSSFFYKQAFLKTGQFPLWDPLMMCGISDTSNMPFPLSLFRVFTLAGFSAIYSVFLTELFFTTMGAVFFYLLMRVYRCARPAALLGAFLYIFWLYKWNVSEGYPMALAPVVFYAAQKYELTLNYKHIFLGAVAVGVTCLTGIIHAVAVIFLFHMVVIACLLKQKAFLKYCLAGFLSWVLGFVLALPSLLPQIKDLAGSQRIFYAKGMFDFVNLDWTKFWLRFNEVLQLFPFSPVFMFCFVLAFLSIFFLKDRKLRTVFYVSVGFFVFHIVLSFTQTAWKALPLIGKFINAFDLYRSAALIGFIVLFFSTYLIHVLTEAPVVARLKRKILVLLSAFFLTGFFAFLYMVALPNAELIIAAGSGVIAFVLVHVFFHNKFLRRGLSVLLVGMVFYYSAVTDGIFFYRYCYKMNIQKKGLPFFQGIMDDFYPRTYLGLFADEPSMSRGLAWKIMEENVAREHLRCADIGVYNFYGKVRFYADGLNSIYGVANIYPARYYEFFAWMSNTPTGETPDAAYAFGIDSELNSTLMSLAGVGWLVTPEDFVSDELRLVWKGEKYALYRNDRVFPRAFAVFQLKAFDDKAGLENYLKGASYEDLRSSAAVLKEDVDGLPAGSVSGSGNGAATITIYEPNQVVVEADLNADGLLVLTDMFHPNWRATVDGVPVEIYPAYHAFRMVALPKGNHTVRFFIKDEAFTLALWISSSTLIGMVLFLFRKKKKRVSVTDREEK